ncbi:MAG TPA: hypothetical protein VN831_06385, partial [Bradyrhizobium sp.]|nr:hypothetical protein [Bradyrhizobium sp.]
PRETHPSCPDLIRASINLRHNFFRRRWITGSSSPAMTISIGMTVFAPCNDDRCSIPADFPSNGDVTIAAPWPN